MIKVNDLTGTVTMSLTDYETLRDRVDEHAEEVEKFQEDLFKVTDNITEYSGRSSGSFSYNTKQIVNWLTKDEMYNDLRGQLRSSRKINQKLQDGINSIKQIAKYRNIMRMRTKLLKAIKSIDI